MSEPDPRAMWERYVRAEQRREALERALCDRVERRQREWERAYSPVIDLLNDLGGQSEDG